jgi:F-type H+-transporting ATPase subunit gamma
MASLRDIKTRIGSVQNTAQITKAMQMVSASKMQRAQDRAISSIPYANGIYQIVSRLGENLEGYTSIYLKKSSEIKNIGIVVIGTSRGFVGGEITSLVLETMSLAGKLKQENPSVNIHGISIHKTAQKILANSGISNDFHFSEFFDAPTTTELSPVFSALEKKFSEGVYDEIYLVYTHFVNTIIQKATSKKLLPLSLSDIIAEAEKVEIEKLEKPFIFEPNTKEVLDRLLPEYFQTQIYSAVLESIASEHSARMVAMQNATDNAYELEKKLTLQFNRTRQSTITQEIIEVISGSLS